MRVHIIEDKKGRKGIILPWPFGEEKEGKVLVEFDGEETREIKKDEIKRDLGWIKVKVDSRCQGCIFWTGMECLRYLPGRYAILCGGDGRKRLPKKIYPFCKKE